MRQSTALIVDSRGARRGFMQDSDSQGPSPAGGEATMLIAQGNAAIRRGAVAVALESYGAALALEPSRFEALANLGSALLAVGRFADAEPHLRRALTLRPDQTPVRLALARACAGQGRWTEAEARYREVLAAAPRDLAVRVEWATTLRYAQRFAEAEEGYRRALAMTGDCAPALYGLALCLRERGEIADAVRCLRAAIAARPDFVDAHYRLAVLAPDDRDGGRLRQLEALAPRVAGMPVPQQVRYWFALGRVRETAGEWDPSFSAYATGNRLEWQQLGSIAQHAAREASEARLVERIRATFDGAYVLTDDGGMPADRRTPVFIVGMPRSGTSLLEQMLAAHPAIRAGGEQQTLPRLLDAAFDVGGTVTGAGYPEAVPRLGTEQLRRLGDAYLDRAWARAGVGGARFVTDKLTRNFLHAGMIQRILPQARIIHVERDPRDACLSCFANLFAGRNVAYSYDQGTLGRYARRCLGLLQHWHRSLPGGMFTRVRYEDLVREPETELRRLLDFIGLPWDSRCLDFHRRRAAVHTVSAGQVQRPLYASSVGRWRRFEPHLGPLLEALEDTSGSAPAAHA